MKPSENLLLIFYFPPEVKGLNTTLIRFRGQKFEIKGVPKLNIQKKNFLDLRKKNIFGTVKLQLKLYTVKGIAFHKEHDLLIFIIIFIRLTSVQNSDELNF